MSSRIASPGMLSPNSMSSYDYISARSAASSTWADSFGTVSDFYSDEDEILYRVSSLSSSIVSGMVSQRGMPSRARSPAVFSDNSDYIVMSRARSPASSDATSSDSRGGIEAELSAAISSLSISRVPNHTPLTAPTATRFNLHRALGMHPVHSAGPTVQPRKFRQSKAKKIAAAQREQASSADSSMNATYSDKKDRVKRRKERRKAQRQADRAAASAPAQSTEAAEAGLGERPIVDDVSEAGDLAVTGAYQDAVSFINSFLSNPTTKSGAAHLRLLQALIVELGLCPSAFSPSSPLSFPSLPSLPHSMRAAKALLKSQVFLNVRDYLAVRSQGLDALRRVMHNDRSSLMREIRAGKKMPVKAVKNAGLNVLLITCH
ncbi:uncharacterized protein B0H18DRAFT_1116664 [Fomitopsis serialis]|uniref:uncharacterized protein n=1 Tax=Fomitopsis serialis TaxID=139415 RepID=UPI002008E6E5|nr:uncharacterized protein B0H18DRAFT_1116664 [Neoantrodia serialis]KAH9930968.1 hypothetical protein B0H18DRAFT_1116664 [Neoantrodia serialis]